MIAELKLGDLSVDVVFKDIKNVHLSVYPPTGRVRISAPARMTMDAIRLFATSKIGWIRKHHSQARRYPRESPREYIERESHYLWGRRYLLAIREGAKSPNVVIGHRAIELCVPQHSSTKKRAAVLEQWLRQELRQRAEALIPKWEKRLGTELRGLFIQKMKTKWGSSSPSRRTIRLNLDLVKHDAACLDYVLLHEMAHFIVPHHGEEFVALLDREYPEWRDVRLMLNESGNLPALN